MKNLGRSQDDNLATPAIETTDLDTTTNSVADIESNLNKTAYNVSGNGDLPISSLHYIEMPIDFSYQLTSRFQVNAGAKGWLFDQSNF